MNCKKRSVSHVGPTSVSRPSLDLNSGNKDLVTGTVHSRLPAPWSPSQTPPPSLQGRPLSFHYEPDSKLCTHRLGTDAPPSFTCPDATFSWVLRVLFLRSRPAVENHFVSKGATNLHTDSFHLSLWEPPVRPVEFEEGTNRYLYT